MVAGDLLLFVDSLTALMNTLVWWLCIGALGGVCIWRSMQNPRLTDLRVTGAALMMWVGTDLLGGLTAFINPIIESILGNLGLYMSLDAISGDVGSMINALLALGVGYGVAGALLSVAGGPPAAPARQSAASKAPVQTGPIIPVGVPGGPPGAPPPPGAPAPPGPPGA